MEGTAMTKEQQDKILKQVLHIRDTGLTNMFDFNAVQQIASDNGFYELVTWMEENKTAYGNLILTGEFK